MKGYSGAGLDDILLHTYLQPRLPMTIEVAGAGPSLVFNASLHVEVPGLGRLSMSPLGQALARQLDGKGVSESIPLGSFLEVLLGTKQVAPLFAQVSQCLAREVEATIASKLNPDPCRALGKFARKEKASLVRRADHTSASSAMKSFMASRRAMDNDDACNYLSVAPDCSGVAHGGYMLCLLTMEGNMAIMGPPQVSQRE